MEVVRRRVGVVAGAVVVAVGSVTSKQHGAGHEVEHDGAAGVRGRAVRPPWRRRSARSSRRSPGRRPRRCRRPAAVVVAEVAASCGRCWWPATSIVLPGAVVPVTVTGEPRTAVRSAGAVTVSVVCPWRVGDVAVDGVGRLLDQPVGGEVRDQPHERAGRPGQRRGRAGRLAVDEADRGDGRIGAERRCAPGRGAPSPARGSGRRPRGTAPSRRAAPRRRPRSPVCSDCSARSPGSAGHRWPVPWPVGAHGWPSTGAVAVAVAVVAVPARPARRCRSDGGVDDGQRAGDVGVVGGEHAEPGQLQEAGVDDGALVERRPAVAEVVGDGRVRVAGLGQPDEVGAVGERAVGGDRPALDPALEVVGGGPVDARRGGVAVDVGDVGAAIRPAISAAIVDGENRTAPPTARSRTTGRGRRRSPPRA